MQEKRNTSLGEVATVPAQVVTTTSRSGRITTVRRPAFYKYLGIRFDSELTMDYQLEHALSQVKAACPQLRIVADALGEVISCLFLEKCVAPKVLWGNVAMSQSQALKVSKKMGLCLAHATKTNHKWMDMPQVKATLLPLVAEVTPWVVTQQRDVLCLQASITRATDKGGMCLAHQHERAAPRSLLEVGKRVPLDKWGLNQMAFGLPKNIFKRKVKMVARGIQSNWRRSIDLKHDAKYGRGSAAVFLQGMGEEHYMHSKEVKSEIQFWHEVVPNTVHREALFRAKFGLLPFVKANLFKWKSQLLKFSDQAASALMACDCGAHGPQDAQHVIMECLHVEEWRDSLIHELRDVVQKMQPTALAVWDSWSQADQMAVGFAPKFSSLFPKECNVLLKRVLAKGVAKLFLLLKDAYGENKGVTQSVVPYVTLASSQARDVSLFVNLDTV